MSDNQQRRRPPGPNDVQPQLGRREKDARKPKSMRPGPWWITCLAVLAINWLLVQVLMPQRSPQRTDVPYTFFKQQVQAGNVADVTSRGDTIQGDFKEARTYPPDQQNAKSSTLFQTVMPQFADTGLESLLEQQGVTINAN